MLVRVLKAVYRKFGYIVPRRTLIKIRNLLSYAGYDMEATEWSGMVIFTSLVAFFIPILIYGVYVQIYPYLNEEFISISIETLLFLGGMMFLLTFIIFIIHLYTLISIRSESAEAIFPDFLYLISSNIRSGMIPFQAFGAAIKPELGILAYEGKKAYEVASATNSISAAFKYLTRRIKSNSIKKFSVIFERTINAGGQAADIIKDYADDLRKLVDLKEELGSQTKGYVAFLLFTNAIILPFLVGVSVHYIRVLTNVSEVTPGGGNQTANPGNSIEAKLGQTSFSIDIKEEEFIFISALFVIFTSFSTSLLIGLIRKGELVRGIKYFPFLALSSLFVMVASLEGLKMMMPLG